MSSTGFNKEVQNAVSLIQESKKCIILSGAGVSTPSGIPDFRSPGKGLWEHVDAGKVATLSAFHNRTDEFFRWLLPLARQIQHAQPNAAHQAIAKLQMDGWVDRVITQNIDNLHIAAGNRNVIEVHGNLKCWECPNLHAVPNQNTVFEDFCQSGEAPRCSQCGTILKPGIVLFEELLPIKTWDAAVDAAASSKCIIVVGSSLTVGPANELPLYALENQAKLVIVNLSQTPLDAYADVVIHDTVETILPKIEKALAE